MPSLNLIRRRQLLSREALAKAAGVSESTIRNIERRGVNPRLTVMRKLAQALNVDPMEVDEFRRAVESEPGQHELVA